MIRLGRTEVVLEGGRYVVTSFDDQPRHEVRCIADTHEDSEELRARARALGFQSVRYMHLTHDLCHTLVAVRELGLDWSPTLRGVAMDDPVDHALADYEERLVLWWQRAHRYDLLALVRELYS